MRIYSGLAKIYDYLLSGVDYDQWADYVEQLARYHRIEPCYCVVDLGCGTGSSTFPWVERGYRACGVDISAEMLSLAREKALQKGLEVDFYEQDMRELDLPLKADLAVLFQDGLNYMLTVEDLKITLRKIRSALRPGGHFIFNLNLVEKLPAGSEPSICWVEEDNLTLIWESSLEPCSKIWRIRLTAFNRREDDGLYEKLQEEHRERSYTREEIEPLLQETGWLVKSCYGAFTFREPSPDERNIFYVMQRED